jgi:hypothetical protein
MANPKVKQTESEPKTYWIDDRILVTKSSITGSGSNFSNIITFEQKK